MKRRHCVYVIRASALSVVACIAVLCVPAVSIAADRSASPAGAADRASTVLALGAGYGQAQGDPRVRALQRSLRARGQRPGPIDGVYGPKTEAAVQRLQRDSGLAVDGTVGPRTRRVLNAKTRTLGAGAGYGQLGGSPQVRDIQRRLRALGQRPGPVDGLYGPRTQAAVERFQRTAGQPVSGVLSGATVAALARADVNESARRASRTRSGNERQRSRPPAIRAESSGADDGGRRGSRPTGGADPSRIAIAMASDDRSGGADGGESSTSPLPLVLLGLALAAIGLLLAGRLTGRSRTLQATGALGGAVKPVPLSTRRRRGPTAIGYVSVRERDGVDRGELRDQVAAINAACHQRGLVVKDVIRDLEQCTELGTERPGMKHALRRLAAGEASCLVVADLGRLSRSALEVRYIVGWFRQRKWRLVAIDERLDTGTKSGAQAADKLVSLSTLGGQRRPSARPGHPDQRSPERASVGSRPAGDEARALKQRIRAMRASGMTLGSIADRLNAERVPTLGGGEKWRPSGVQAATGNRQPPGARVSGNGVELAGNGSSGGLASDRSTGNVHAVLGPLPPRRQPVPERSGGAR